MDLTDISRSATAPCFSHEWSWDPRCGRRAAASAVGHQGPLGSSCAADRYLYLVHSRPGPSAAVQALSSADPPASLSLGSPASMAGKKGKGGGGASATSKSSGGGASPSSSRAAGGGGGRDGQPPGNRSKAGGGRGGGGRGGRKGPANNFIPARILRKWAAMCLSPQLPPRPHPLELERPSLPGIGLLQRIGALSAGKKLVAGELVGPDNLLRFDWDMVGGLTRRACLRVDCGWTLAQGAAAMVPGQLPATSSAGKHRAAHYPLHQNALPAGGRRGDELQPRAGAAPAEHLPAAHSEPPRAGCDCNNVAAANARRTGVKRCRSAELHSRSKSAAAFCLPP